MGSIWCRARSNWCLLSELMSTTIFAMSMNLIIIYFLIRVDIVSEKQWLFLLFQGSWEKRILKSLNSMCTELSIPLARKVNLTFLTFSAEILLWVKYWNMSQSCITVSLVSLHLLVHQVSFFLIKICKCQMFDYVLDIFLLCITSSDCYNEPMLQPYLDICLLS